MLGSQRAVPRAQANLVAAVEEFIADGAAPAERMIRDLVACEHSYINTDHPAFIGGSRAIAQVLLTSPLRCEGLQTVLHVFRTLKITSLYAASPAHMTRVHLALASCGAAFACLSCACCAREPGLLHSHTSYHKFLGVSVL